MLTLHQQNVYRRVELGNNGRYANLDMRLLRIYHTINPYHSHCTNFHIDSLKNYFTQFGEVSECTVMRDSATGRSRGFGFLTFRDPKCVNTVMVKEHYLDGKIVRDVVPPRAQTNEAIDRSQASYPQRRTGANQQDLCWWCQPGSHRRGFHKLLQAVRPRCRRHPDDRQGNRQASRIRIRYL